MQRKAKVSDSQKQQSEKRKKLQDEFITSFTKRLESSGGEKDRCVQQALGDRGDGAYHFLDNGFTLSKSILLPQVSAFASIVMNNKCHTPRSILFYYVIFCSGCGTCAREARGGRGGAPRKPTVRKMRGKILDETKAVTHKFLRNNMKL